MHASYPRAEMERRVLDAVERGWALHQLEMEFGFPSRQTVFRWAKEDPGFAQRLKDAQAWRRGLRVEAREAASYNEAVAEAFLLRVRRGEAVRDLVKDKTLPGREQLNRWKRERPDFAARLDEAWRFSASVRQKKRWMVYEEAVADHIILRVAKGESVPEVLADPELPGETAVRRWKRLEPDFAAALDIAKRAGHRVKMRRRSKLTPKLAGRIYRRLADGLSLHAISKLPGMPHYVTLYGWVKRDAEFARQVRMGEKFRDWVMMDDQYEIVMAAKTPGEVEVARRRIGEINKQLGRMRPKRRVDED